MSSSPPDRAALRRHLITQREALAPALHASLSAAINQHLAGLLASLPVSVLGFCWPWRKEADVLPAVTAWLAADPTRRAALPRVQDETRMDFVAWQAGVAMQADRFGIPTPREAVSLTPDTLLVPLNAFDACGYRLGYGGGYFDRMLAALQPRPRTIGVGFELARVEDLAPQAHDIRMDWIITEHGVQVAP